MGNQNDLTVGIDGRKHDASERASRLSAVPSTVKRGFRFLHKHWQNLDGSPMEHEVTRVAKGVVYYRPVGGGSAAKAGLEEFAAKYVERDDSDERDAHEESLRGRYLRGKAVRL